MVGYLFNKKCSSIRELYYSVVGGGNATFIGCQPPLNLIEEGLSAIMPYLAHIHGFVVVQLASYIVHNL